MSTPEETIADLTAKLDSWRRIIEIACNAQADDYRSMSWDARVGRAVIKAVDDIPPEHRLIPRAPRP